MFPDFGAMQSGLAELVDLLTRMTEAVELIARIEAASVTDPDLRKHLGITGHRLAQSVIEDGPDQPHPKRIIHPTLSGEF